MKIYNEKIDVVSSKINENYRFCLIADIHNTKYAKYSIWQKLIDRIRELKPDYILISGDLIYTADDLLSEENKEKFLFLIKGLLDTASVIMVRGNHDLKDGQILKEKDTLEFFRSLESMNLGLHKLHLLENETFKIDDINFIGITPCFDAYYFQHEDLWEKYFIDALLQNNLDISDEYYNVMVTHSPLILARLERFIDEFLNKKDVARLKRAKKILDMIDVFVCGHMHNGQVPKHWQKLKLVKGHRGIVVTEGKSIRDVRLRKVDYCRGVHNIFNGKLIINGGISKWCQPNPFFAIVQNHLTSKDITTIELKKVK